MPFTAHKLLAAGSPPQDLVINGGTNFILTSHVPFTDFVKAAPITVTLTGTFKSTSTATPAFRTGDLSTWSDVDIIVASGGYIEGLGGKGGAGSSDFVPGDPGFAAGDAFESHVNNLSSIVSLVNNGTIAGGGGGGGGGGDAGSVVFRFVGGPVPCAGVAVQFAGGGGGGGGAGIGAAGNAGVNRLTSPPTLGQDDPVPGAGGVGTQTAGGISGIAGGVQESSSCGGPSRCDAGVGGVGGARGAVGLTGGTAQVGNQTLQVGGAGGAAGAWIQNNTTIDIITQGTTFGATS